MNRRWFDSTPCVLRLLALSIALGQIPEGKASEISLPLGFERAPGPQATSTPLPSDAELDVIRQRIDRLKTAVGGVYLQLDRERDRNGKLRRELLGDLAAGCWASTKIDKLELLITGSHLPREAKGSQEESPKDSGSPALMQFRFGDFAYDHADEEKQSVFVPGGVLALGSQYAAKRIGDIEYLAIKKGGNGYDSEEYRDGWLFPKTKYKVFERNRYRLDSVTLKVNDVIIYRKDGINFSFGGENLEWTDRDFASNIDFQNLMARTDCR